jgi:hypothetical protein
MAMIPTPVIPIVRTAAPPIATDTITREARNVAEARIGIRESIRSIMRQGSIYTVQGCLMPI